MYTVGHKTLNPKLKQMTAVCHTPDCLYSALVYVEISKTLHHSLRHPIKGENNEHR
ncbi:MAG: hypothetical protein Q4B88_06390 [Moraxella sp.]|nr:hypothetical protein [Moraxella sp.]